jgi:hypothetical protein
MLTKAEQESISASRALCVYDGDSYAVFVALAASRKNYVRVPTAQETHSVSLQTNYRNHTHSLLFSSDPISS